MTGHFTTLDGCERWGQLVGGCGDFYRVPYSLRTEYSNDTPLALQGQTCAYRMYKLESVEFSRGLAHYVEVLQ